MFTFTCCSRCIIRKQDWKVGIENHCSHAHVELNQAVTWSVPPPTTTHTHISRHTPVNKHRELSNKAPLVIMGGGEIQIYLFQNEACRSTEGQLSSICHRWSHTRLTQGFIHLVVFDSWIFPAHSHQESHGIFWRQTKKENTLWQGVGSLWMQMSLGKFTEQLAGSEAPASVTRHISPYQAQPTLLPRGLRAYRGPTARTDTLTEKGMEILWLTCTASATSDYYFHENDKLTVFTCHLQNGWWVWGFIIKHSSPHPSLCVEYVCMCVWGCVTCITWHLAPLLSCSKDSKSNAMWQVNPFISVILHPDPASAAQRPIQLLHTKNDH